MISRGPQWDRRWKHSRPLSSRIYASLKSLRYATLPSCSFPSLLNSFLPSFSFLFSLMRSSPPVTWRSPALTLVVTLRASSVLYFSLTFLYFLKQRKKWMFCLLQWMIWSQVLGVLEMNSLSRQILMNYQNHLLLIRSNLLIHTRKKKRYQVSSNFFAEGKIPWYKRCNLSCRGNVHLFIVP